jgi:hypothetical protein
MYKAQKGLNDVSRVSFLIQLENRTLTKKKKNHPSLIKIEPRYKRKKKFKLGLFREFFYFSRRDVQELQLEIFYYYYFSK